MEADDGRATDSTPILFTGKTGEYFRIWIVNIALTIVTVGLYSPWAKVRKLRYFYGNTSLADGHFDYHAKPTAILIGRLIAVGMLGIYWASGYFNPIAPTVVIIIVILMVPWLVVRSRIFQMRNTSYHGLRFNFQRNYKGAFKAYYGGAAFTIITLGFGAPTAMHMRNRFVADNTGYGQTKFVFDGLRGEFYSIFWKTIGLGFLGAIGYVILMATVGGFAPPIEPDVNDPESIEMMINSFLLTAPLFLVYAAIGVYNMVRQRNYVWNTTRLGDNRFQSTLSVVGMLGYYASNALAIICSLGLLAPWAQIRLARYRADHMHVHLADDWKDFIAASHEAGSALGDEVGEAFDVDIDIAF